MVQRLPLLIVAFSLTLVTGASAHPHVWVTVQTTVLFKAGAIVALQQRWTFDEFYAAMATEGLDKNNDGIYDRQELAPLAQVNMDGIKGFDYFTFAKLGTDKLEFAPPTDYWLEYPNKVLTLHFTLPLAKPLPATAKGFAFSTYDASFYIDFELAEKDAIALRGDVPAGCAVAISDEEGEAQRLSDAFKQQFGDTKYGGTMGQPARVECPAQ